MTLRSFTVITWNMGKSLKIIKDWKGELEKWSIIDPEIDIIGITIQETSKECGSKLFLEALQSKLKSHTIISEGEGPMLPSLNFHVYVYVCIKNEIINVLYRKSKTLCIRKQGMCTKPSVGIRVDLGCVKLVFVGSHFPIDTKEKTLGFADRVSAMKEINTQIIKPLTDRLDRNNFRVFWAGDMNFRIQPEKDNNEEQLGCLIEGCRNKSVNGCPHILNEKILSKCLPKVDLLTESETGIEDFEKSCRYKESKKGHEYETMEMRLSDSDKKYDDRRIPSYCDRILTRGQGIDIKTYTSWPIHKSPDIYPPSILYSDHEPVYMTGTIECSSQTGGWLQLKELFHSI